VKVIWTPRSQRVADRVAEGAREAALLWFVFSALDALVSGGLTFDWLMANSLGSIMVWSLAMYLELVVKEHA
jgi:hypothetical protein